MCLEELWRKCVLFFTFSDHAYLESGSKGILPGLIISGQDWTDMVFLELFKRTDSTQHEPFLLFKYAWQVITEGVKSISWRMYRKRTCWKIVGELVELEPL